MAHSTAWNEASERAVCIAIPLAAVPVGSYVWLEEGLMNHMPTINTKVLKSSLCTKHHPSGSLCVG